jgi:hypothetical protein
MARGGFLMPSGPTYGAGAGRVRPEGMREDPPLGWRSGYFGRGWFGLEIMGWEPHFGFGLGWEGEGIEGIWELVEGV